MQHFFVHITWFQMCILEILLLPEERVHFSSDCNMQFGSMVVQILSIVFCTVKTMIDCMIYQKAWFLHIQEARAQRQTMVSMFNYMHRQNCVILLVVAYQTIFRKHV